MNKINTIKLNQIDSGLALLIKNLIKECGIYDNSTYDIFTENDSNYSDNFNCFYLHFNDDLLTGFLSVFAPTNEEFNIYACTLPSFRNQGIFTTLFKEFKEEIHTLNNIKILFPINMNNFSADLSIDLLKKHNFKYNTSDYIMKYDLLKSITPIDNIFIELEYEENDDSEYEISLWIKDTYIGGCLIYYGNDDSATIYQYGIVDEYQNKGYGKTGLILILNFLQNKNIKSAILHVTGENKKACSLYLGCGFDIICEEQYFTN